MNKRLKLRRAEKKVARIFDDHKGIEENFVKAITDLDFTNREEDPDVKSGVFMMRGSFHAPLSPKEAPSRFVEFYDMEPPIFAGMIANFLINNPHFLNWAAKAVQVAGMQLKKDKKLILPDDDQKQGPRSNLKVVK